MRDLVPRRAGVITSLLLALVCTPVAAQPAIPAGRVKAAIGGASIVRSGQAQPAVVGAVVYESDTLRTAADGRLSVMLKDETRLSLGPATEVALARFTYQPAEDRLGLVLRMARGGLSYVSGRIAALMPEAVRRETPTAVVGGRGTHALVRAEAP